MSKIIAHILTPIYFLVFGLLLLVFHPIQWLCLKIGGYGPHKKSVDYLNFGLTYCLMLLGTRISFTNDVKLPRDRPIIFASNHQSMNDIPPLIWFLRKHHPKFIAKKSLGQGIPSVSFNLRHGGACLIDRKNPQQATRDIVEFAKRCENKNWSAVIFPEGTRSRDGNPKPFARTGLKMLMTHMPSAVVVPVSIQNSWKLLKYGKYPYGVGAHMKFRTHAPIEMEGKDPDDLVLQVQEVVHATVNQGNAS